MMLWLIWVSSSFFWGWSTTQTWCWQPHLAFMLLSQIVHHLRTTLVRGSKSCCENHVPSFSKFNSWFWGLNIFCCHCGLRDHSLWYCKWLHQSLSRAHHTEHVVVRSSPEEKCLSPLHSSPGWSQSIKWHKNSSVKFNICEIQLIQVACLWELFFQMGFSGLCLEPNS